MDRYWEENSKMQKSSETTKVMRLNNKEVRLIDFIRYASPELLTELRNAFSNSTNKSNCLNLKRIISILENRPVFDLDFLIDIKVLFKEEADYLVKSMRENKNIIITSSRSGSGKTTLFNSLLNCQEDATMLIFEREKELNLSEEALKRNVITFQQSESISMKDIAILNGSESSALVIGDIQNCDDGLGLLSALNMGSSVLGTMQSKGNLREDLLDLFEGNMKKYAEETLNKNKFIHVNVSLNDDRKRVVTKIEEV